MKTIRLLIPVVAALLLAAEAAAQTDDKAAAEAELERAEAMRTQALQESEARDAEVTRRLEEAERKMAEAAREIAELTSDRLPQLQQVERRIEFIDADKPRLGVTVGDDQENGPVEGVRIMAVTPGSAADDAGLRAGDILTSVNDESLSADDGGEAAQLLVEFMGGVEEGDVLTVEYLRGGKVGSVEVEPRPVEMRGFSFFGAPRDFTLPDVPEIHVAPGDVDALVNRFDFRWLGNAWGDMELVALNEGLGKYFGTDSGLLVVSAPESDALQLEDGDVIQKIDGREPTSVRHALRILSSYQPGETLTLEIMRDKRKQTLSIEVPDNRSSMASPAPRPAVATRPAAWFAPETDKT